MDVGIGMAGQPYRPGAAGPIGIAADRHGSLWVSSLNDRVQAYAPDGRYLMGIGGLSRPHGLAFDRAGHLFVADAGAQRIRMYRVPAPEK
jgi:sugar lactone lactonase YvrE